MVSTAGAVMPGIALRLDSPDVLSPGFKAGPWIVERELGRGGMGAVYAVVHEDIGKRAALKLMHRRLIEGTSAERIVLEAKVVNQIGHPNIVDVFETGELADGRPYIVMERLDGVSLGLRADDTKLLPDRVIDILLQVCEALIAAHAAGVVHRDLKADNIFLTESGAKVLDWGIAKVISADPHHTIEGQLVGTPQYLAPEQARGAAVSPATDVYSLGVVAYELFLEQLPFEAETSAEIMAMHLRATPPPPSELWPDIPRALEDLILAMLAKEPAGRPGMETVAATLRMVREELDAKRRRTAEQPRAATRWMSAPGLAPTLPAGWRSSSRRWQFLVGAMAVVAALAMFLITHDAERAAAAAVAPASATAAVAPLLDAHASEPAPVARVDAPAPLATTPVRAPVRHVVSRRLPVKPHRDLAHDPDGTLDPYR